MAEYHYKYDPPRRGPDRNRRNNGGGLLGLLLEILFTLVATVPSLVAMAVSKLVRLLGGSGVSSASQPGMGIGMGMGQSWVGPNAVGQAANPAAATNPGQAQQSAATASAPKGTKRRVKVTAGRGAIIAGGIMLGLFGTSFAICLAEAASAGALTATGILSGWSLFTLFLGLRRRRKAKLYLKYLGLIGRRESVSLTTLAQAAGRSRKKVCTELQDMLDQGILPTGYLDLAADQLILSAQGIDDKPQEEAEAPEGPSDENDILRQIKEVNDSIPDPVMSAKIDRIGEITGKILDYQRKNPSKAGQLRSFLNYYLPTTLKILRAYAQLDKQGVEGANISAAKIRIEGMMDKVVEGFEKQLDRLFQDEALDITSDVAVLEQMLDKDGLGESSLNLGSASGT